MKIIALVSQKGGSGKSTLAVNLAGALSLRGKTSLSDEDATVRTAQDWLTGSSIPVDLVPPDAKPVTDTKYYVLDVEGRPRLEDVVALSKIATVLIPGGPNGGELMPIARMWVALAKAGAEMANVRVVITKAPPVGNVGQVARDDLRGMGVTVCTTVIRQYAAHQRALEQQLLVRDVTDARAENAWSDIVTLALEVC
jgi:chromosome partitioning protein